MKRKLGIFFAVLLVLSLSFASAGFFDFLKKQESITITGYDVAGGECELGSANCPSGYKCVDVDVPNDPENYFGKCLVVPVCGNGEIQSGEECDDGNTVKGDGCSSECLSEEVEVAPVEIADPVEETTEECVLADGEEKVCEHEGDEYTLIRDGCSLGILYEGELLDEDGIMETSLGVNETPIHYDALDTPLSELNEGVGIFEDEIFVLTNFYDDLADTEELFYELRNVECSESEVESGVLEVELQDMVGNNDLIFDEIGDIKTTRSIDIKLVGCSQGYAYFTFSPAYDYEEIKFGYFSEVFSVRPGYLLENGVKVTNESSCSDEFLEISFEGIPYGCQDGGCAGEGPTPDEVEEKCSSVPVSILEGETVTYCGDQIAIAFMSSSNVKFQVNGVYTGSLEEGGKFLDEMNGPYVVKDILYNTKEEKQGVVQIGVVQEENCEHDWIFVVEGESKTFCDNEVQAAFLSSDSVKLSINGVFTGALSEGDEFSQGDFVYKISSISYSGKEGVASVAELEYKSGEGKFLDELTDEEIEEVINETNAQPAQISCSGCELENGKCVPVGYRKSGDYCSVETGEMEKQLIIEGAICENNFECSSNVCVDGECLSSGFIQKILNKLRSILGIGETPKTVKVSEGEVEISNGDDSYSGFSDDEDEVETEDQAEDEEPSQVVNLEKGAIIPKDFAA